MLLGYIIITNNRGKMVINLNSYVTSVLLTYSKVLTIHPHYSETFGPLTRDLESRIGDNDVIKTKSILRKDTLD